MPADVSGTINIIAEVVGRGQESPAAAGDVLKGKNKRDERKNTLNILGMQFEIGKLLKIMGVAGILSQSKLMSGSIKAIFDLLGALMDIVIAPLMPLLMKGLTIFAGIVNAAANMSIPDSWSDLWQGLLDWFTNLWETEGGLWGIIKATLEGAAGVSLLTALLATMTFGPKTGWWVLSNTFGKGVGFTTAFLSSIFGIGSKQSLPTRLMNAGKTAGTFVAQAFASSTALAKRMFSKAALFTKSKISAAMGLAGKVPYVSKLASKAWKAVLFTGQAVGAAAGAAAGAAGSALGVLRKVATSVAKVATGKIGLLVILGALVVFASFSAIAVLNYLCNQIIGKGIADTLDGLFDLFKRTSGMMRGGGFTSMRGSSAMLDVEVTSSGTTIFTDINRPSGV
tara:strand:+ start:1095 stop:2282 length:1188 start_codon:yes stop_codon:yes gene_type:complete